MLPARFFARLFAVALMLGGLGAVTVLAPAGAAVQVAGGNAEVPPEIEEEKTIPLAAEPVATDEVRAEILVAHAAPPTAPRGAPPTPPPEA